MNLDFRCRLRGHERYVFLRKLRSFKCRRCPEGTYDSVLRVVFRLELFHSVFPLLALQGDLSNQLFHLLNVIARVVVQLIGHKSVSGRIVHKLLIFFTFALQGSASEHVAHSWEFHDCREHLKLLILPLSRLS